MPNYILAYHGGTKPETPEEGAEHMARWQAWADGLGAALVNRGTPLGTTKTVTSDGVTEGGGVDPMIGYSILEADNINTAVKMVENSPHVNFGGTMVVAEMIPM